MAHLHRPRTALPTFRSRARSAVLAAGLVTGLLLGTPLPAAVAAPADDVTEAQSAHEAAAAELARIQALVTAAEQELQRMTVEAEAASDAALVAQAQLAAAQAAAAATAAELAAAQAAVGQAEDDVATLGREAYMGADERYGDIALLLDADSPGEVLQQAATLEQLGDQRSEVLEAFEVVEQQEEQADRDAQAAVAAMDQAARAAADAEAAANAHLATAQASFDALAAEKAALDQQLHDAGVALLALQGAPDPESSWNAQQEAEADATVLQTAGGAVAPTNGRVTSCYGARWGTMHYGVDIAAAIGTPVFAPEGGVVLEAGPASGFGLAVYVQHADGTITVYGHVNQYFVSAGDVVTTGQQIAEVGNRGQSTGPHLHFEVHVGGLYAERTSPMPWLSARGVTLGGSC